MTGDAEKRHPATRETADHSIPYVVACALARGTVNRRDLDESALADPEDADALIKAIWTLDAAGSSDALFAWTASGDR